MFRRLVLQARALVAKIAALSGSWKTRASGFFFDKRQIDDMRGAILSHFLVSWKYCFRTRALVGVVVLGIAIFLLAALVASFSLRQPQVVALDLGFSGVRILGAFLAVLWIQDVFFRDIDKRLLLSAFAYPVPRSAYVLGRLAGVLAIMALAVVIWSAGLVVLASFADWGYTGSSRPALGIGFILEMLGLTMDLSLIAVFTLLVVSVSETPQMPLFAGLSFAVASRSISDVIGYLDLSLDQADSLRISLLPWVQGLRWLLPDLGRLDVRPAMLYGSSFDMLILAKTYAACSGYLIIVLLLVVRNYERREFS